MRPVSFMEELLTIEAETKHFLGIRDRSHERTLMQELSKILEEAESLFGPRDSSFELAVPRVSECANPKTYIFHPLRQIRIYLTSYSKTQAWIASLELAHEAIHALNPAPFTWSPTGPTILEEGLAEYFAQRYVSRLYGLRFENEYDPKCDEVLRAVASLMAKNEFLIKELRMQQPAISKIDARLLVEVAGIESPHAEFLCSDFNRYWRTTSPSTGNTAQGGHRFVNWARSVWDSS